MKSSIEIIKAEQGHIPQIMELWRRLMLYHADFDPWCELLENAEQQYSEFIAKAIEDDRSLFLLAVEDDKTVGYIYGNIRENPPVIREYRQFYLEDMFVRPEYRGRGIGKILLDKTIEWVKAKNIEKIQLDVHLKNPRGYNFWKECGFQEECCLMFKEV